MNNNQFSSVSQAQNHIFQKNFEINNKYVSAQYSEADYIKAKRLYYVDKKENNVKKLYDNLPRDLGIITRADTLNKPLHVKARILLTNLIQMLNNSKHSEIFIDHDWMKSINEVTSSVQNKRILAQLKDILEFKYHNFIKFHGVNKMYGYVVKFTKDGQERINNPTSFYKVQNLDLVYENLYRDSTKMSTYLDKNVDLYKEYIKNNSLIANDKINLKEARQLPSHIQTLTFNNVENQKVPFKNSEYFAPAKKIVLEDAFLTEEEATGLRKKLNLNYSTSEMMDILKKALCRNGFKSRFSNNRSQFLGLMEALIKNHRPNTSKQCETVIESPPLAQDEIDQNTTLGKIQYVIAARKGVDYYRQWFKNAKIVSEDFANNKIVIEFYTSFRAEYVKANYSCWISRALCHEVLKVEIETVYVDVNSNGNQLVIQWKYLLDDTHTAKNKVKTVEEIVRDLAKQFTV